MSEATQQIATTEPPVEGGSALLRANVIGPQSEPSIAEFFAAHHRLPRLGDEIAPWRYRGFLLPYVIDLHAHPLFGKDRPHAETDALGIPQKLLERGVGDCPDRWGYYLRTLDAGHLLAEPLPTVSWCAEFEPRVRRLWESETQGLGAWMRVIEHKDGYSWDTFRQLVAWLGWALGTEREPPRLNEAAHEALYRTVNLEPMLLMPSDYLGSFLAATKSSGFNPLGFYPTPMVLCNMMIEITMGSARQDGRDGRTLSVCDPCVGTGRMLLVASNYSLNLYGQDIDPLVVAITKINAALYAPWIMWPLPSSVLGDDTYIPPPSPAPLPVAQPITPQPPPRGKQRRVDDVQGSLFD